MRVTFLGVGEACDERIPNTSIWVQAGKGKERSSILFDCGFTAPSEYWRHNENADDLDALWISHFHGDHFFGIPALLIRLWEMKREKPLLVLGQQGVDDIVSRAVELAYPSFMKKFAFQLNFMPVEPETEVRAAGVLWRAALNGHSQRDLAVRIEREGQSIFYSGDGLPTEQTLDIARNSDLIIHEAFRLETEMAGHGSIRQCIEFARKARAGTLALVHVQRDERRTRYEDILKVINGVTDFRVILPEAGDEMEL